LSKLREKGTEKMNTEYTPEYYVRVEGTNGMGHRILSTTDFSEAYQMWVAVLTGDREGYSIVTLSVD
jgi:hypothetical protein